jgi:uncharacterized protein with von Willebrand factor type A (vWA) domain
MNYRLPMPKEDAEKSRTARGWASFREWGKKNLQQQADFRQQMHGASKDDKQRFTELIRLLEVDYETLIRPNL